MLERLAHRDEVEALRFEIGMRQRADEGVQTRFAYDAHRGLAEVHAGDIPSQGVHATEERSAAAAEIKQSPLAVEGNGESPMPGGLDRGNNRGEDAPPSARADIRRTVRIAEN